MDYQELELAGIEVKELLARLMNNSRLIRMFICRFLEDQTCSRLAAAVDSQDWQAAEFACHALKGVCGNLSLKGLFALTQEQLRLFRDGKSSEAAAMMNEITRKYHAAILHMQIWLDQQ